MMLYLGLLAGVLQLVGYLLYVRDEEIEPNPVTWLMFAYGTMLLTMLEWDRQASAGELALPLVCSSMAVFVAGRCWWRARRADPSRYWPREWWPDDWRDRASFQADLALTARYDVNEFWMFKGEGHFIQGTADLSAADNPPEKLEKNWGLFLVQTVLTF